MSTTLIADAGSTKTSWIVTDSDGHIVKSLITDGINPAVMSPDSVSQLIKTRLLPEIASIKPDRIRYYGAGINSLTNSEIIFSALDNLKCHDIEIASDILGAARALLGHSAGIACILGTGSNSALYDGDKIVANVPPLGYILGDEGSGAVIARRFIGDIFKGLLPSPVKEAWLDETALDMNAVIEKVYRQPGANSFLASFMPLIIKLSRYPEVNSLIDDELSRFFSRNIALYATSSRRVGFVGSLSFHLEDNLRRVAASFGYEITSILPRPIEALAAYHANDEKFN